jgi:hypothetical protein
LTREQLNARMIAPMVNANAIQEIVNPNAK